MYYVYLLESVGNRGARYTGFTTDLKARLASHNAGQTRSTKQARPWRIVSYFAFADESVARAFEKYLKTGSGKTFAQRHFVSPQPPVTTAACP
jgi:predicted GIY-YIG superfamily endonuclease